MVHTGYEGSGHCRKKNDITRFNLVTVLFELYIWYRYVIWWKYWYRHKIQAIENGPTCTKRVSKQGCDRASAKSHPRGRGLFYVDISGTSSVKWLYQVSMTYPQLISAATFFSLASIPLCRGAVNKSAGKLAKGSLIPRHLHCVYCRWRGVVLF